MRAELQVVRAGRVTTSTYHLITHQLLLLALSLYWASFWSSTKHTYKHNM